MTKALNLEFMDQSLNFFKNHSVVPPSDINGQVRESEVLCDAAEFVKFTNKTDLSSETVNAAQTVIWVDFRTSMGNEFGAKTFIRRQAPAPNENWRAIGSAVPIHFLPWQSMSLVGLQIPSFDSRPKYLKDGEFAFPTSLGAGAAPAGGGAAAAAAAGGGGGAAAAAAAAAGGGGGGAAAAAAAAGGGAAAAAAAGGGGAAAGGAAAAGFSSHSAFHIDPRNPPFFFTAAINGCSVFVDGEPHSPKVYHGGITGKLQVDAAQFWEETYLMVNDQVPDGIMKQINKKHYMSASAPTDLTNQFFSWLVDAHEKRLKIETVNPWGCVFGIRYGRLWSFYLQESVTVTSYEYKKTKDVVPPYDRGAGAKPKWTTLLKKDPATGAMNVEILRKLFRTIFVVRHVTSSPLRVSEFWPGGRGRYSEHIKYRKIK